MKKKEIVSLLSEFSYQHVLEAMEIIDKSNIPSKRKSIAYNVLSLDSRSFYPPPLLIEKAYKISTNKDLPPNFFQNIGKKSPHFKRLEELGFTINSKSKMTIQFNTIIFKKVPANEVGTGTEIAVLKKYFTSGFIDDPKDFLEADDNEGSKSYSVKTSYKGIKYNYEIKAYKTQEYGKDRRLILNHSNDPLGLDRETDDYLAIMFNNKITKDSPIEIKVIYKNNNFYSEIEKLYGQRSGLVLSKNKNPELFESFINEKQILSPMTQPLNQILYGPPGTGKTYSTITKALDIIGVEYKNYEEAQELFQNELGKRIDFVTMHQSFSYEDFVQGLKPSPTEDGSGVVFKYKNGVFKEICERAHMDTAWSEANSTLKQITNKKTGLVYSFEDLFESIKLEIKKNGFFRAKRNNAYFRIKEIDGDSMKTYTKDGEGKLFTLNKTTLKKFYDDPTHEMEGNNSDYYKGILINYHEGLDQKNNNKFSYDQTQNNNDDKFVIILDEINRANISRVFGELIALIEKDKRNGKLTATLPSGEPFTVPSNLHIIGTMNTADKSIALVDIALRRRFEFKALYPDPNILKNELKENGFSNNDIQQRVNMLTCLNRIIRAKKSVDFEIGHSYFMDNDTLVNILNKQVLPLLNEYFMYDLKKVKEIIEKTQKDKEGEAIPKPGIIFNNQIWKDRGLLEVESIKSAEENLDVVETDETTQD